MLKRIIFDIDNTLIKWEDSYYQNLNQVFEELNISYTQKDINGIIGSIAEYESKEAYFNREIMQKRIEEKLERKLPANFVDTMLNYFSNCVPEKLPDEIPETLNYLSQKYELVTLSNWFEETQEMRLEKLGIRKYFKATYAGETIKIKPNPESYYMAIGEHKPEECLMVGDNITYDVQGAEKCHLQVLYYNPKGLETNYPSIQTIKELMERL